MTFSLQSPAFAATGALPRRFTADGEDVSPPLWIEDIPPAAQSLALVVIDPDAPDPRAPTTTFDHWVLYNLPPSMTTIPEGAGARPPAKALEGRNGYGQCGYRGPNPPVGRHRYFFRLFALDQRLPDLVGPTRLELERAMAGHVLDTAEIIATYERARR
ncbi:MAG: YbhB/YbcL family Raf kinase inhibitor-like protein [Myxococcota bacterium]